MTIFLSLYIFCVVDYESSDENESKTKMKKIMIARSHVFFAKATVQDVVSYNSIVSCADWAYAAHLLDVAQVEFG